MGKSFSWSFSALEGFETCARKYEAYSVSKTVKDDNTDNRDWGNFVHDAFKNCFLHKKELPDSIKPYQVWVDRVNAGPGKLLVEQKYALTSDLTPCPYFAPIVWYRGIADVVRLLDRVALAIDWKTGSRKPDSIQLGLMALCLFQSYADLKVVRTEFVWLKEDPNDPNATTQKIWRREQMPEFVGSVIPRVKKLEWAFKTNTWEESPSGLCVKYCNVTGCQYHGKGTSR